MHSGGERRLRYDGDEGRGFLKREFRSDHAQLEFGATGGKYPEWDFGSEPVVANQEKVVVATLPDVEGDALLEVWRSVNQATPGDVGALIYDGVRPLAGQGAEAGSFLGCDLESVSLDPGDHRLKGLRRSARLRVPNRSSVESCLNPGVGRMGCASVM
jgi:hypothetical protein